VKLIVRGPGRVESVHPFGGTIVDAALQPTDGAAANDRWGEMSAFFRVGMTMRATDVRVVEPGGPGLPSVVVARGPGDLAEPVDLRGMAYVLTRTVPGARDVLFDLIIGGLPPLSDGLAAYLPHPGVDVDVETRYTLRPGARAVEIETTLTNRGDAEIVTPVGDLIEAQGDLEVFSPAGSSASDVFVRATSSGFDELTFGAVDWFGYAGDTVSYGYVPPPGPGGGAGAAQFSVSGLNGVFLGTTDTADVLLPQLATSPFPRIARGASTTWTRHFVVGDGSLSSISDVVFALRGRETGTLAGTVTEAGTGAPLAGVRITALLDAAPFEAVTQLRTDAEGRYEGTLPPGAYGLIAFEGSGIGSDNRPALVDPEPVVVAAGERTERDLVLGRTGTLDVEAVEAAAGTPLPIKITLVGVDPTPRRARAS